MGRTLINLIYYSLNQGCGNFGDEMSKFITESLINPDKYELSYNLKNSDINLICVGSYISAACNDCHIYGSGVIHPKKAVYAFDRLRVHATRGPMTRDFLINRKIDCPSVFGDPGLLISRFYTPTSIEELNDKIGVIPHVSQYTMYKNKGLDSSKYCLIDPCSHFKTVMDQIYSCKCIVSSSLHGLICSDSYGKPNVWLQEKQIKFGDFKFRDYFLSQGRDGLFIKSLDELNELDELNDLNELDNSVDKILYVKGNTINLDVLVAAFPFA
jgi:pyruvyltransferase